MATFLKCDGCDKEIASDQRTLARVTMVIATTEDQEFTAVPRRRDTPEHFDLCALCLKRLGRAIDPRAFRHRDLESDLAAALQDHDGFGVRAA